MNDYPSLDPKVPDDATELLRTIVDERQTDVKDFDNLVNRFMAGRQVGKVPVNSLDVDSNDRIGDFCYDHNSGYYYRLLDNSGGGEWIRMPLEKAW